ncbi:hypothetical protein B0T11DRAFT_301504 [Plectosphaerella cucumerina]|uniref:Uncharacterized protein n=1 Tax=Plectosphaerella cucumerina TaxID=40658 RepID=A0A8K0T9U8_9PEZI|nr:hypothetical protein B0T11DRAFT_301504 [Plectosphaerella cucumerina]
MEDDIISILDAFGARLQSLNAQVRRVVPPDADRQRHASRRHQQPTAPVPDLRNDVDELITEFRQIYKKVLARHGEKRASQASSTPKTQAIRASTLPPRPAPGAPVPAQPSIAKPAFALAPEEIGEGIIYHLARFATDTRFGIYPDDSDKLEKFIRRYRAITDYGQAYHLVVNLTDYLAVSINFLHPDEPVFPEDVAACEACGLYNVDHPSIRHIGTTDAESTDPEEDKPRKKPRLVGPRPTAKVAKAAKAAKTAKTAKTTPAADNMTAETVSKHTDPTTAEETTRPTEAKTLPASADVDLGTREAAHARDDAVTTREPRLAEAEDPSAETLLTELQAVVDNAKSIDNHCSPPTLDRKSLPTPRVLRLACALRGREKQVTEDHMFLKASAAALWEQILTLKNRILQHGDCDCEVIQAYISNVASQVSNSSAC